MEENSQPENKKKEIKPITGEDLVKAGVHLGHISSRWNPKMKSYIYTTHKGNHIIDLRKTVSALEKVFQFIKKTRKHNGKILFLGTKVHSKDIVKREAERCGMPYVHNRWLGGTFTNFKVIKNSIKSYLDMKAAKESGEFEKFSKKAQSAKELELKKAAEKFDGIANLRELPAAIFITSVKDEYIAVKEAQDCKIPIIGIVDTNADPNGIDYVIPSNDDAYRALEYMIRKVADMILIADQQY